MNEILGTLKLRPIEFEKIDKHGKIGDELVLASNKQFVCLIDGNFVLGTFHPVCFGLNFYGGSIGSQQFDPYRTNHTGFQAIWEVEGAEEIAAALEPEYAAWGKQYCIDHKLTRGGKRITEADPVESFKYFRNRPVTKDEEDDEE